MHYHQKSLFYFHPSTFQLFLQSPPGNFIKATPLRNPRPLLSFQKISLTQKYPSKQTLQCETNLIQWTVWFLPMVSYTPSDYFLVCSSWGRPSGWAGIWRYFTSLDWCRMCNPRCWILVRFYSWQVKSTCWKDCPLFYKRKRTNSIFDKKLNYFLPCPCKSMKCLIGLVLCSWAKYFLILCVSGVNYLIRN